VEIQNSKENDNGILDNHQFGRSIMVTVEGVYPHNVRRFPMMMYTCFVRGDRSRWAPQKVQLGRKEDGVYSKYGEKYVFASCYCGGGVIQDAITLSSNWSYSDAREKFNCS